LRDLDVVRCEVGKYASRDVIDGHKLCTKLGCTAQVDLRNSTFRIET